MFHCSWCPVVEVDDVLLQIHEAVRHPISSYKKRTASATHNAHAVTEKAAAHKPAVGAEAAHTGRRKHGRPKGSKTKRRNVVGDGGPQPAGDSDTSNDVEPQLRLVDAAIGDHVRLADIAARARGAHEPVAKRARRKCAAKKRTSNVCSVCHKVLLVAKRMDEHMRTHTGEKPYQCATCGKRFAHRSGIGQHRKRHGHGGGASEPAFGCLPQRGRDADALTTGC